MNRAEYLKTLDAVEQETEQLLKDRSQIDQRLMQLKTTADSLRDLLGIGGLDVKIDGIVSELGITDAIREVLASSRIPMSASLIKSELANCGVDLSAYANAGAVIYNTLTRLEKQGEVVRVQNPAGQTVAYAIKPGLKLKQEGYEILSEAPPSSFGQSLKGVKVTFSNPQKSSPSSGWEAITAHVLKSSPPGSEKK